MTTRHDEAVRALAWTFAQWGYPVATEAGIPGGRADLVVFHRASRNPAYVIEVKTGYLRSHFAADQVDRYARWFRATPVLAMAIGSGVSPVRRRAHELRVVVLEFDFDSIIATSQAGDFSNVDFVPLPYHVVPSWTTAAA